MPNENDPAPAGTDDAALFNDVTTSPVEKTEIEPPAPPTPGPKAETAPEPMIPAARLREVTEEKREAQRERDDYRRRLDEFYARQQPKAEPPKRSDLFDAPSAFVQEEVKPLLDPVQSRVNEALEHYSLRDAAREFGKDKVWAAREALRSALAARDSEAVAVFNRAMSSIDPYGEIMTWHTSKEVLSTVGPDLKAYRQKIEQELLDDPEHYKRVNERMRGQAASTGNSVNRPVVPKVPSIGKVGAAASAADSAEENLSEEELFREATRRR